MRELRYWGLSFSNHLVTIENGRRLAQQKIVQGNSVPYPVNPQRNDWSQQCRGIFHLLLSLIHFV
jgi:hypothetical protein